MALPKPQPRPRRRPDQTPAVPAATPAAPMAAEPRRWTYEDYCAIPDDGYRYEVIGGKLYVAPAPDTTHQRAALQLATILNVFVGEHDLGEVLIAPTDVLLPGDSTVQPDLLFIRKERLDIVNDRNVTGAPDLVVEILSPSTAAYDRSEKRDAYAAAGVPHYWIVSYRARSLEAYELREGAYVLVQRLTNDEVFSPALFPGLSFPLTRLWR